MECKHSRATRFRNLIINESDLSINLHANPVEITANELVQRAFAVAGDDVVSDRKLREICADVLYKLSESRHQNAEAMVGVSMWLNDFSSLKNFVIDNIDPPPGLTAEQSARKFNEHRDVAPAQRRVAGDLFRRSRPIDA
jgi:hypothetical protein